MSSRFFIGQSESESESESDSEHEIQNTRVAVSKFGAAYESSSESEDEKRVVRSQKDRTWDSILERINRMKKARNNNDWNAVQNEFDEVNKTVTKAKMIILQHGLPKCYVKMMGDLEDMVNTVAKDKESLKKMKPAAERSFNRLKLAVKKHNKKYEAELADFRANPDSYVEVEVPAKESEKRRGDRSSDEDSSDESESSEEDSSSSEDEDDDESSSSESSSNSASEDDDDSIFGSSDTDDSDEEVEAVAGAGELMEAAMEKANLAKGSKRNFWLKKSAVESDDDSDTEDDAERKERKVAREQLAHERKAKKLEEMEAAARRKAMLRSDDFRMTEDQLEAKVTELVSARGRKGTDVRVTIRHLEVLTKVARDFGAKKEIPVLMHFISTTFDSLHSMDDYLDINVWRHCCRSIHRVLTLLDKHKSYTLRLAKGEDIANAAVGGGLKPAASASTAAVVDLTEDDAASVSTVDRNSIVVVGGLGTFLSRLKDDYTRSLQQINPHTQEYILRLADEALLIELSERIQAYYQRTGDNSQAAVVAVAQVEFMYYKHDSMAAAVSRAYVFNKQWGSRADLHPASLGKMDTIRNAKKLDVAHVHPAAFLGNPTATGTSTGTAAAATPAAATATASTPPSSSSPTAVSVSAKKIDELCTFVFKYGDERLKTRALLCAVYHHALHDRYHKARDMFLISHIQESIDKVDVTTQILYNRTLATLGLCAFRQGLVQKCFDCLSMLTGRVRELLAQGMSKYFLTEKDPDLERVEKRRQMPYHMHINPDLLECCYLISAMFLDLPSLCKNPTSMMSPYRQFRKYFSNYNRQIFTGPPENTREHVLGAAKAILNSDWRGATELITKLDVWNLIPADGGERVKTMLCKRIKEDGVRIFMLTAAANYEAISLSHLCNIFQCEPAPARRIISKMIFTKEISAAWEPKQDMIVIYKPDSTPLQTVTLQVADKLVALVESNERVLDPLVGAYGYKDEGWTRDSRKSGDHGQGARGNRQGGRGRGEHGGGRGQRGEGGSRLPHRVSAGGGEHGHGGGHGHGGHGHGGHGGNRGGRGYRGGKDHRGGRGRSGGGGGGNQGGAGGSGGAGAAVGNVWGNNSNSGNAARKMQ